MPATETRSLKTSTTSPNVGIMVPEGFASLLAEGTGDVFKRGFDFPFQGEMFYEMDTINKETEKFQSVVGLGNVGQNRDADELPIDEQSEGFSHSITTYVYRGKTGYERRLFEDELYGQIRDNAQELREGSSRSVELIMADGVNRALGASGAPFLAEDGGYWLDSSRNNPHAKGGQWSNVEATSVISAAAIFQAQLNFRSHVGERGHKDPKTMTNVYIRPADEESIWEILKSDLRPTDSMNAKNFQMGRFQYTVYDHLTTALILYKAEGRNEVKGLWRSRPGLETFTDGNPDILYQRVRFRFGIGAVRPDVWRGGTVS